MSKFKYFCEHNVRGFYIKSKMEKALEILLDEDKSTEAIEGNKHVMIHGLIYNLFDDCKIGLWEYDMMYGWSFRYYL